MPKDPSFQCLFHECPNVPVIMYWSLSNLDNNWFRYRCDFHKATHFDINHWPKVSFRIGV